MEKSDRDISEWDARLRTQLQRSFHNYHVRRIDLSVARENKKLDWTGEIIIVEKASSSSAIAKLRLNYDDADLLTLEENVEIESIFGGVFLTNDAQPDEWLDVIEGINFSYKKKIAELSKILPCVKTEPLHFLSTSGVQIDIRKLFGVMLAADNTQYVRCYCGILTDFKAGGTFTPVIDWCPLGANGTGSDKNWVMRLQYNYGRAGEVVGNTQYPADMLLTIPDGEAAEKMHKSELNAIPGLQKGDILSLSIYRMGAEVEDDFASAVCVGHPGKGKYTADKIGVLV